MIVMNVDHIKVKIVCLVQFNIRMRVWAWTNLLSFKVLHPVVFLIIT